MTRYGPNGTVLELSARHTRRLPWFRRTVVRFNTVAPQNVAGKCNPALNVLDGNSVAPESCADWAFALLRRGHESVGITATALGFFGFVWAAGKHADTLQVEGDPFVVWPFDNGICEPGFMAENSPVRALLRTVFTEAAAARIMLRVAKDGEPWSADAPLPGQGDDELREATGRASPMRTPKPSTGMSFTALFNPDPAKTAIIDISFRAWLRDVIDELPYEVAMAYSLFGMPCHLAVADDAMKLRRKTDAFHVGAAWVMSPINYLISPRLQTRSRPAAAAALRARIVEECNCGAIGDYRDKARHEVAWRNACQPRPKPKDFASLATLAEWGAIDSEWPWILSKTKLVSKETSSAAAVWAMPRMYPGEWHFVYERFVRVLDALRTNVLALHIVPLAGPLARARAGIKASAPDDLDRVFPCKKFNPPDVAPQTSSNDGIMCVRDAERVNWTFLAAAVDARVATVYLYGSTVNAVANVGLKRGGAAWLRLLTSATYIYRSAVTVHADCLAATCYDVAGPNFRHVSARANVEIVAYRNDPPILTDAALREMNLKYHEPPGVVPWGSVIEALRRNAEEEGPPRKRICNG